LEFNPTAERAFDCTKSSARGKHYIDYFVPTEKREFVDECSSIQEDGKICSTIINLAENLELSTVAEGVENQQQLEFLVRSGCEVFQGYYFYKPLDASTVEGLLKRASITHGS
jgi:predicted signal transduction protein with EAL and GGDEF domain